MKVCSKLIKLLVIGFLFFKPVMAIAVDQSFVSLAEKAEDVIIKDGEFNDGLNDYWVVSNPDANNPSLVTDENGNNYVKASNGESILQYVQLKPNMTYKFTYYVIGTPGFPAVVEFGTLNHDEGFKSLKEEKHEEETWKQHEFTFVTPEEENTYAIRFASSGNGTAYFDNIQATSLDLEAPTVPLHLKVESVTTDSVSLSWEPSTDNVGVTGYLIYRDQEEVGQVDGDTLTYINEGLTADTEYTYEVRAIDQAGSKSEASNAVKARTSVAEDTEAPTAPLNLKVTGVTTDSVSLSWEPSTDNVGVTGYLIYRDQEEVGQVDGDTLTYINEGLTADTEYTYEVRAIDQAESKSEASNAVKARTSVAEDTEAPTAPLNLKVTGVTTDSVSLSWEPSTDNVGVTGYLIYRDQEEVGQVDGDTLTYINEGLTADTEYTYEVRAIDQAGNKSEASNVVKARTSVAEDTEAPTAPLNLKVTGVTTDSVSLSWEPSTVGVTGYLIYRDQEEIGQVDGDTLTYINEGLTADTEYTYEVRAIDQAGNKSEASNAVKARTSVDKELTVPMPPTALRAAKVMEDKVVLMWDAPSDPLEISTYQIYRNGLPVGEVKGETFTYTDTGLTENTKYYYTVKAKNTIGNLSKDSNSIEVLTSKKIETSSSKEQTTSASSDNTKDQTTNNLKPKNEKTSNSAMDNTNKKMTTILPLTGSKVSPIIQMLGIIIVGFVGWIILRTLKNRKKN
jgi:chitodextrinase